MLHRQLTFPHVTVLCQCSEIVRGEWRERIYHSALQLKAKGSPVLKKNRGVVCHPIDPACVFGHRNNFFVAPDVSLMVILEDPGRCLTEITTNSIGGDSINIALPQRGQETQDRVRETGSWQDTRL